MFLRPKGVKICVKGKEYPLKILYTLFLEPHIVLLSDVNYFFTFCFFVRSSIGGGGEFVNNKMAGDRVD
jgi:hypothetical protein